MKIAIYSNNTVKDLGGRLSSSGLLVGNALLDNPNNDVYIFTSDDISLKNEVDVNLRHHHKTINMYDYNLGYDLSEKKLPNMDLVIMKGQSPDIKLLNYLDNNLESKGIPILNGTNMYDTALKSYCDKAVILEHMPDSVFSNSIDDLMYAIKDFGTAILKPNNEGCGRGIEKVTYDLSLEDHLWEKTNHGKDVIVAQRFMPEYKQGDKRIITLISKNSVDAIAMFNRFPMEGSILCNLHAGGSYNSEIEVSKKERQAIEKIASTLYDDKIYIGGLDFINEKLIEINTVNPGLRLPEKDLLDKNFYKRINTFVQNFMRDYK